MCGRFAIYEKPQALKKHFRLDSEPRVMSNYNITPDRTILAIIKEQLEPAFVYLKWGLVPHWSTKGKPDYKMINARLEGVWEKPSFRSAIRYRRCLIPASGFYEWKKEGSGKTPYFIAIKGSSIFAMAGIWEVWEDKSSGEIIESCAILTTEAKGVVRDIHERMPVILDRTGYDQWLDPKVQTKKDLEIRQFDPALLFAHPVSTKVNSPANNSLELIYPYEKK